MALEGGAMNHSGDCMNCDGSCFVTWYDESADCQDEDNCECVYASSYIDLCPQCRKVNAVLAEAP